MNAWTFFRRARIILLSFLVMSCLAWTTLLTVFLVHEWSYFSHFQRVVIISLLSLYGFTAILLYLMVVVHFRLWWDMARMFTLLIIHAGGSVAFTLYNPSFPCRGFSTETVCRELVHVIFIGCWAFCGIILCFVVALGIMAFLPRPVESLSGKGETELPPSPARSKREVSLTNSALHPFILLTPGRDYSITTNPQRSSFLRLMHLSWQTEIPKRLVLSDHLLCGRAFRPKIILQGSLPAFFPDLVEPTRLILILFVIPHPHPHPSIHRRQ
ncbi:hypothetical protein B0F90DRAFT_767016 [Multifurca ochricompacta]|uniref:Uncharacterized protein n=1 Tax=Multifurca ochricompacta TaxID=376703 RepID=A0AAD4MAE6_9AGAM|nr:hypothetical protein B0F90DRAFT_767016 [Multifurca ochricompacta]